MKVESAKSLAISLHSIAGALFTAQTLTSKWLGMSGYFSKKSKQKRFLKLYTQLVADNKKVSEMKVIAHSDPSVVDAFLNTGNGVSSKIGKTDITFSIGALFEIFLKWEKKGEMLPMNFMGTMVKASKTSEVFCYNKNTIELKAVNGDKMYLRLGVAGSSFELYEEVVQLSKTLKGQEKVSVHFPFVKLRTEQKLKWLETLDLNPDEVHQHPGYTIPEALTKNELDMDNVGARIKSASKVNYMMKCARPKELRLVVFDEPFILWVMRPGCVLPIFAAAITRDALIKTTKGAQDE